MKMSEMQPGMRVTYVAPEDPAYQWHGIVGKIFGTEEKVVKFDDGKMFLLNEEAAENFQPYMLN